MKERIHRGGRAGRRWRVFLSQEAGFIGSNFVLSWIEEGRGPVVNVDKLTYAGALITWPHWARTDGHLFVEGDMGMRP